MRRVVGLEEMKSKVACYNAIKIMLHYIPLRFISERQRNKAVKLINVKSYGYPLGNDNKEMFWLNDIEKNSFLFCML